jgi:dUTP pyrophosphatase
VLDIEILWLPHGAGLPAPAAQTAGSAGYDVCSADDLELKPGDRGMARTGFSLAIPSGYECQVRPRSGLAVKHGVTLPNAPATIDSDYRGELKVPLINLGRETFHVTRGMRIAQMVFARVEQVTFRQVPKLEATTRGEGAFGSTGR